MTRRRRIPDAVFFGPMVSLLDENSGSDGDIFPAMFRELVLDH